MRDLPHVGLDVEQITQFLVRLDSRFDRLEAVVGDFLRRRQNQVFRFRSPILNQHRQHDAGGDCRFGVLLADEHEERLDESPPFVRVAWYIAVGTENGFGELRHPRAALTERDADIDNL